MPRDTYVEKHPCPECGGTRWWPLAGFDYMYECSSCKYPEIYYPPDPPPVKPKEQVKSSRPPNYFGGAYA